MALNIDIVNSTVINVYETVGVPRSYFGAVGTSGKFYPSGTSGDLNDNSFGGQSTPTIVSNTLNVPDTSTDVISYPSSVNAIPVTLTIEIVSNIPVLVIPAVAPSNNGYAIGDTLTILGSDLGGDGELVIKITSLAINGLLIVVGGDFYQTRWDNLVVGGTSPTSLSDAQSLLATLFSTL